RDGAAWEIVDFAPRIPDGLGVRVPYEIVRLLRPIAGQPRLRIDFDPRPDYARGRPEMVPVTDGLDIGWPGHMARLATNLPIPYLVARREFVLDRPIFLVLTYGARDELPTLSSVLGDLE